MGFAHVRALSVALIGALLVAATASAHEIGTTNVIATFNRDHTYTVDVASRSPLIRGQSAKNLLDAAEIRFGGVRVVPELQRLPNGTIRFHGDIPKNAGPFTWR